MKEKEFYDTLTEDENEMLQEYLLESFNDISDIGGNEDD